MNKKKLKIVFVGLYLLILTNFVEFIDVIENINANYDKVTGLDIFIYLLFIGFPILFGFSFTSVAFLTLYYRFAYPSKGSFIWENKELNNLKIYKFLLMLILFSFISSLAMVVIRSTYFPNNPL